MHDVLLTAWRILSALKHAFQVDLGMELIFLKCKVLISAIILGDRAMTIADVVKIDGFICVGVPIGTPAFVEAWASAKNRELIKDLQKLKLMSNPLIHYHLVRFCGLTRPGYMRRTLPPGHLQTPTVGLKEFDLAVSAEIFTKGAWVSSGALGLTGPWHGCQWHRTTLQLPEGGLWPNSRLHLGHPCCCGHFTPNQATI